ncbi:MAG TPA: FecR domain-containing protein [Rhizomicrobium sp.]
MSGVPEVYMSADEIDARASEFILRQHDVGDWNESDQQSLDTWLDESLSHRTSYWRLEAAWLRADRLDALKHLPADTGEVVSNRRRRFGFVVAAAVLVAALAGTAAFNYPWRGTDVAYATNVGGHRTILLADGSRVELNTDTDLRIETDATHRTVRLVKGEAFFQIRHDAARPFVVLANGHRVTDLGTEFLVRENGDGVKVAVVEGRARLEYTDESKEHQAIVLSPGEEAVSTRNALSVTKKTVTESESELGWRHGMLMFHHTALPDVAAEYNRYNRTKIVIADPQVAALTISATLPTTDVGAFARMAQNFLGLHVEKEGDEVLISR